MKRNESGFTLIELVLVGVLLSVFVGLAVPGVRRGFQRFMDEKASSEIEEVSSYARSIAVMRGIPYRLSFSAEEGAYRLLQGRDGLFVPVTGSAGRRHLLPNGTRPQGPVLELTFLPNGTAIGGGTQFWRDQKALWKLNVDPVLGETKIVELDSETRG